MRLDFIQFSKCYFQSDTEQRDITETASCTFLHRLYTHIRAACNISVIGF